MQLRGLVRLLRLRMQHAMVLMMQLERARETLLLEPIGRMKLLQEHPPHQTRLILLRAARVKSAQTLLSESTPENKVTV